MSVKISNITKLIISIVTPRMLESIGGLIISDAVTEWYATLNRPFFNPPNWVFVPVWTTIYLLLGVSLYYVWKQEPSQNRKKALIVFVIQMVLNFAWTFIFFHFHLFLLALIEIVVMWFSILFMILRFYKVKPMSAYINIPYLLWVSYAVVLTVSFYYLNK